MNEFELFQAALDIDDLAARQGFLSSTCGGNAELRSRIEALLASHAGQSQFLKVPVVQQLADVAETEAAATILVGDGSTQDNNPDATVDPPIVHSPGAGTMTEHLESENEETPLGYLESSTKPDSLGRLGHYEVLEVIGRGAFGTVLRALDEKLQRVVAIKVMSPEMASTSPARKRFIREAQASAAIRHEHVVSVHAVEEKPIPYLVMDYIPGLNLQQRLDEQGPLDVATVLRLGRQIAEGLAAAHAQDLIHRDVKPANILLETGAREMVKVTDFGLARAADDASVTQSGIIAGTPMYMAPEQALGNKLDQRADLFSFGSVLYQMVSGRPPFRAANTLAVLKRLNEDTPRPIREIIPETPQWLCDIITKLHAKNPDERYQSAREVAEVLADCESQLKTIARLQDFSRIPVLSSAGSDKWKWVTAAAVLLVVIGTGVGAMNWPNQRQEAVKSVTPIGDTIPNLATVDSGSTDLIPFARPEFGHGSWVVREGKLVHPARSDVPREAMGWPALPLAVRGPDEYDLEAEFERTIGTDYIAIGMSAYGHRFNIALDVSGRFAELQAVDGIYHDERNPTRRTGPWLTTGRRHTLRCQVRASGIQAWLDGREVVDYRGPYESLTCDPPGLDWAPFFIKGNYNCEFVVHKLVLTPRSDLAAPPVSIGTQPLPPLAIAPFNATQARAHQEAWAKHLGVPVEYTNSIGMKFVLIPPGEFMMGSTREQMDAASAVAGMDDVWKEHIRSEGPRHKVVLTRPVYLGAHEVTQAQYGRIMGSHVGYFSATGIGAGSVIGMDTGNHPVEMVSWNDAAEFCAKLSETEQLKAGYSRSGDTVSQLEGNGYRLPTEAVWEFSCRAGTTSNCWPGDEAESLLNSAWFKANSTKRTHAVGELKANPFGLYDIHGNVWEWIEDRWDVDYYQRFSEKAAIDPAGASAEAGLRHGLRGGDWACLLSSCRSSHRHVDTATARFGSVGFRVSLPVDAVKAARQQAPSTLVKLEALPPTYENSIGTEFVLVPKGKSWLRGANNTPGDLLVEIPADFYLGKYEVTQDEWEKVMGENPSHFSRDGDGLVTVKEVTDAELKRFPVENVTWEQCQQFLNKLNKVEKQRQSGWVYRLPTEAEWEYACRGGPLSSESDSAFDFYFAKPTNTLLPQQANFQPHGLGRTCQVGLFEPNGLGLYDLHGNVEEWCHDQAVLIDLPLGPSIRGGAYDDPPTVNVSVVRHGGQPSAARNNLGLRLARVPFGDPALEVKIRSARPDRPAAAYVLSIGGKIKVNDDDREINAVADLPSESIRLTSVSLDHNNQVTESGLSFFQDCTHLVRLNLAFTPMGDVGLAHFKSCKNLASLNLNSTLVTDAGLAHFKGCTGLTSLRLDATNVTDRGLVHFQDCKDLTYLNLNHTKVSDVGLATFKGKSLGVLWIDNTGITDLTPLQGMPLEDIRLTPKNITRGLDILRDKKSLKTIGVDSKRAWPAAEFWERYEKGEFKE